LLGLVLIGLYLRIHNIDSPPIGYHNMKETEYLTQAREFYFNGDFLHRRIAWLGMQSESGAGYFEEYAQLPILPWLMVLGWKIFGIHVWVGRAIVIGFSILCIPMIYHVSYELTRKKEISLYSAVLMAILPLGVFFGRNIQPESPALFFVLLSTYYFLRWTGDFTPKYLLASLIPLSIAGLFKYTSMIAVVPLFFVFPLEKLKDKRHKEKLKGQILLAVIGISPIFLWAFVSKFTSTQSGTLFTYGRISIFEVFSGVYWGEHYGIIKKYVIDNFTSFYIMTAFIGLALSLREYKSQVSRFLLTSALMVVPYSMLLSDFIRQHSYYQMPFLPLVALSSAYFFYQLTQMNIGKTKQFRLFLVIALIATSLPGIKQSIDHHYDITFYGLDTAGDSISELSGETERVYIAGKSQTVGMLWNAKRNGAFMPTSLDEFRFGEDERHMRWIFAYDEYGLYKLNENPALWAYISENYSVKEAGFLKIEEESAQLYLILKKGGTMDAGIANKPVLKREYGLSEFKAQVYTIRPD
jgi:4-amino-4-deoxy-L-arabinose transferase-like glycosyltransferase